MNLLLNTEQNVRIVGVAAAAGIQAFPDPLRLTREHVK